MTRRIATVSSVSTAADALSEPDDMMNEVEARVSNANGESDGGMKKSRAPTTEAGRPIGDKSVQ